MDAGRCFIFGAGESCRLRSAPSQGDMVIAADGGVRLCAELGLRPTLIVGDFDSSPRPEPGPDVIQLPVEKDDTDALYAVRLALERGCREFHLYGGAGGRLDHTLANLQTLLYIARRGGRGFMYNADMTMTAIENDVLRLPGISGLLSVFCMGSQARGVFLQGVHYPLTDAVLTPDFPLGVSNKALGELAEVRVNDGALAVLWED